MLNEFDSVAALGCTATAKPNLFFGIDRKAVIAATSGAWTNAVDLSAQLDPALIDDVFNGN